MEGLVIDQVEGLKDKVPGSDGRGTCTLRADPEFMSLVLGIATRAVAER